MDTDIRKPETTQGAAAINRPTRTTVTASTSNSKSNSRRSSSVAEEPYHEPVSEDENEPHEDEAVPTTMADDEGRAIGLDDAHRDAVADARGFREESLRKARESGEPKPADGDENGSSWTPPVLKLTPGNLDRLLRTKYGGDGDAEGETMSKTDAAAAGLEVDPVATAGQSGIRRPEFTSAYRAQKGKLISVPIRIEPKVYYANERTFLVRLRGPCASLTV